jgi:hypothetical protein
VKKKRKMGGGEEMEKGIRRRRKGKAMRKRKTKKRKKRSKKKRKIGWRRRRYYTEHEVMKYSECTGFMFVSRVAWNLCMRVWVSDVKQNNPVLHVMSLSLSEISQCFTLCHCLSAK